MVATKHQTIDTGELSYFVRQQLEGGYTHFEVDLTKDVRTGKPRKDYRRIVVRYWRPHPGFKQQIPCPDCDRTFPSTSTLKVHQLAKKHGPFAEPKALYSGAELVQEAKP